MKYKPNAHTAKIRKWLASGSKANGSKTRDWLKTRGHDQYGIVHLLHGDKLAKERKKFVAEFNIQ